MSIEPLYSYILILCILCKTLYVGMVMVTLIPMGSIVYMESIPFLRSIVMGKQYK